jgi:hypothetical protein
MNQKKLCPILLSGFLASTKERDTLDSHNDQCKCNENCAWYDEGLFEKCKLINGVTCMGMGMER